MLPFKMRMYQFIGQADRPVDADFIMNGLKGEYGTERQFTRKRVEFYLDSLASVAMIRENNVSFNQENELAVEYELTALGKERLKYLPLNR